MCPIALKVGHVTLYTPPSGSFIIPHVVLHGLSNKEKTKCLASSVEKLWRAGSQNLQSRTVGHVTLANAHFGVIHYSSSVV